jgi:SAM-dependent methyltransferase
MSNLMTARFPTIWHGSFPDKAAYDAACSKGQWLRGLIDVAGQIDHRLVASSQPFEIPAYCSVCEQVRPMQMTWYFSACDANGAVHPAWTETYTCKGCGLNSRMRAVMDYLKTHCLNAEHVYFAEASTRSFKAAKSLFKDLTGSEYLGAGRQPGRRYLLAKRRILVRHEDLTALTFASDSFDLIVTQDVFEHISRYRDAFREILRVLSAGGQLVFSIPFFPNEAKSRIRATVDESGAVHHILPPEIHGNPVDASGSLCFQNFGWDILDIFAECGFSAPTAHLYWGPWQGHLGVPFFVFSASKPPRC